MSLNGGPESDPTDLGFWCVVPFHRVLRDFPAIDTDLLHLTELGALGLHEIYSSLGTSQGISKQNQDSLSLPSESESGIEKIGRSEHIQFMMKLFDSHCHLQDPRIFERAPNVIKTALDKGVVNFVVNGTCENDWHLVKQMSDSYPSVIPSFGVHPWFVIDKTPNWFSNLKEYFEKTPSAAVGEIGLDKGSKGKTIDFDVQTEVFRKQLELAKDLKRPASIHCVRAFGDLLEIMKSVGPFPNGVILHSFLGSAEMVPELARLGAYFSFSGFLMSLKESKAVKMLKTVPVDRILLETDSPDAMPNSSYSDLLIPIEGDDFSSEENVNHPANIRVILKYVASLLEMEEDKLAEISYRNALRVFSYEGSKVVFEG